MAGFEELGRAVMRTDRVKAYLVTTPDGHVLSSENASDGEQLASLAALCLMQLASLETLLGLRRLKHLVFTTASRQDLIVLRQDSFCLVVIKEHAYSTNDVVTDLRAVLAEFSRL